MYDENGNWIESGQAFNLNAFNSNKFNVGQSTSPDLASSLSSFGNSTNYGMSYPTVGSDISNIGVGTNNSGGILDSLKAFMGGKSADGSTNPNYAGMLMGALQGFGSMYMGNKQLKLAKDQFAFSKDAYNRNYEAQRTTTNGAINDRNVARTASRQGASSSPYQPLQLVA